MTLSQFTRKLVSLREIAGEFGLRAAATILFCRLFRAREMRLKLPGIKTWVVVRNEGSDLPTLRQVIGRHEGMVSLSHPPKLIVDGGANVGYASLMYANAYPDATIIAVEPDATNCEMWRRNCAQYPNLQLLPAAIWPRSCVLECENPADESWSFRMREPQHSEGSQSIRAVTISEIIRAGGDRQIDLLKLDIEGAEKELFAEGTKDWLPKVDVLVCELHDRFKPGCREVVQAALDEFSHQLSQQGDYVVVARFQHSQQPVH